MDSHADPNPEPATLAEVRVAAGHASVAVTSGYLHVLVDDEEVVGDLFELGK